jgi:nicotinamidase-related amidase
MKTALLVIDPQKIYTDEESEMFCADAAATIKRINSLLENAVSKKQLVVLIRHVHKGDGSDVGRLFDFTGEAEEDFNFKENSVEVEYDHRLARPDSAVELTKNRYSAFAGTSLAKTLDKYKIEKVVVCGFMTNFCCESTARDALDRDYYVDFIVDATGTPGTENYDEAEIRTIVKELLSAGFANVYSTKTYLKR